MRDDDRQPDAMFSSMSMEDRIPQDHPLRAMPSLVNVALTEMSPRFTPMYVKTGRPSITPEKLLRAQFLQILYTIRSERLPDRRDHRAAGPPAASFRWKLLRLAHASINDGAVRIQSDGSSGCPWMTQSGTRPAIDFSRRAPQ
jgi:hypothetical protein